MSAQDAEVFRKAAEVLERDGWIQGNFHDDPGHCAVGALEIGLWGHAYQYDTTEQEIDELFRLERLFATHLGVHSVPIWNDATDRAREDVVKGFLQAADREDVRGDGG